MNTATCSLGMCRHDSNCSRTNCEGHPNKDEDLLAQCAASGQMSASQINAHHMNGELNLRRVMAQQIGRDITTGQDRRDRVLTQFNEMADREEFESTNWDAISKLVRLSLILGALAMFAMAGWYFSH